jgi:hypothetical protein
MCVACADDQDAPYGKERGGDRQADLWRHHRAKGFVPPELPAEPSPSGADFFSDRPGHQPSSLISGGVSSSIHASNSAGVNRSMSIPASRSVSRISACRSASVAWIFGCLLRASRNAALLLSAKFRAKELELKGMNLNDEAQQVKITLNDYAQVVGR